eukprot:scaffold59185_cov57-Attheya_sp.AAC.1
MSTTAMDLVEANSWDSLRERLAAPSYHHHHQHHDDDSCKDDLSDQKRRVCRKVSPEDQYDYEDSSEDGLNAFHRLVATPLAPSDVLLKFVEKDPRYVIQPAQSHCRPLGDDIPYTPLHMALETGSVESVSHILNLMHQYHEHNERTASKPTPTPTPTRRPSQPHDFRSMVEHWCGTFNLLTCVWGRFFSPDVALYFHNSQRRHHHHRTNNGESPQHDDYSAIDHDSEDEEALLKRIKSNIIELSQLTPNLEEASKDFQNVWAKTLLLVRVAVYNCPPCQLPTEMKNPLHLIAQSGGETVGAWTTPSMAVYCACKLYPEQLQERDADGNLPLHLAAKHAYHDVFGYATYAGQLLEYKYKYILYQTRKGAISRLLQCYPAAASIKDAEGRLPLVLALESGKHTYSAMELARAAPHSLDTRDEQTRLYPFLLAAIPAVDRNTNTKDDSNTTVNAVSQVETIMSLLRESPQRIESGILCTKETACPKSISGLEDNVQTLPTTNHIKKYSAPQRTSKRRGSLDWIFDGSYRIFS